MASASKSIPFPVFSQLYAGEPRITAANNRQPGVHTFYFCSNSGAMYVVQNIRRARQRRWFCNCPDFIHRRIAHRRHCKHARLLARMARLADGVVRLSRADLSAVRP